MVEDDSIDAMTVRRAFKDLKLANKLIHRVNGEEALEYLRNPDAEIRCVILLDLNMPRMNGLEFLEEIKKDQTLCRIPVVVLTTSTESCDIDETFSHSVAGYMVKPIDFDKMIKIIHIVNDYWSINVLPVR